MAIATIERDPARDTGSPELRFRLLQQVCGSPVVGFWRAIDRRSGKSCVVRVIDADSEQSSRRLGELHRERTLGERIGHPGVLRAEVPTIESERIFQVVDPEPARAVDVDTEGGRLAVLNLLVAVGAVLAEAHARGVFHGAFTRASCLRAGDGRALVQGFMGDAVSAAAMRDGAAADHRAFLEFASEMLRQTGGAPPRLRRYFAQYLAESPPNPPATAMADLCADLRESLEDTFPWPLAGPAPGVAVEAESPTLTLPILAPDAKAAAPAPAPPTAPALVVVSPSKRAAPLPPSVGAIPPSDVLQLAADEPQAPVAPLAERAARNRRGSGRAAKRQAIAADAEPALADVPVLQQLTASPTTAIARGKLEAAHEVVDAGEDEPRGRRGRAWLVALFVLLAVTMTLYVSGRARAPATPAPTAVAASAVSSPPDSTAAAPAAPDAGKAATLQPVVVSEAAAKPAATREAPRSVVASAAAAPKPTTPTSTSTTAAVRATTAAVKPGSVPAPGARSDAAAMPGPERTSPAADAVAAPPPPQAVRKRVATLVAGGNRALNALEPSAAAEAFAAALALSPDDRAARDGSQRARRLEGVAALMRDAREAASRGDHGRAVQGYSQALANDPRNRGLAEALATARRNLGRDATSTLLAEGHAALGAGRFEQARDAFEKALAADPLAPGAKRAAEQAATAILLRDEAEARRGSTTVAGRD